MKMPSPTSAPPRGSRFVALALAAVLVAVIVGVIVFARRAPPAPPHPRPVSWRSSSC